MMDGIQFYLILLASDDLEMNYLSGVTDFCFVTHSTIIEHFR
jgi:hypothetical protein